MTLVLHCGKWKLEEGVPDGVPIVRSTFPAGEPFMKMDLDLYAGKSYAVESRFEDIEIVAGLSSPDDIFDLILMKDILDRRFPNTSKRLLLPYVPFGRQDRVMTDGEPFGLKVFSKIINDMNFSEVVTVTPHSDVTGALIDRLVVKDDFLELLTFLIKVHIDPKDAVFVAPDAGAMKRVEKAAKYCKCDTVVYASKHREIATGKVTGITIPTIHPSRPIVVVDDICDGGATFIELAKHLPPNRKSLTLHVTHGIFSRGRQVLLDAGYDNVNATFDFLEKK